MNASIHGHRRHAILLLCTLVTGGYAVSASAAPTNEVGCPPATGNTASAPSSSGSAPPAVYACTANNGFNPGVYNTNPNVPQPLSALGLLGSMAQTQCAPATAPTASSASAPVSTTANPKTTSCNYPKKLSPNIVSAYLHSKSHSNGCDQELYLALTIYGEAEGQNMASKIAVGDVIKNRLESKMWGNTYKSVVTAPGQFDSWFPGANNTGRIENASGAAWQQSINAAKKVTSSSNTVPGALLYYSPATQAQEHQNNPTIYPLSPPWAQPKDEVPNPTGVSKNEFKFYK